MLDRPCLKSRAHAPPRQEHRVVPGASADRASAEDARAGGPAHVHRPLALILPARLPVGRRLPRPRAAPGLRLFMEAVQLFMDAMLAFVDAVKLCMDAVLVVVGQMLAFIHSHADVQPQHPPIRC